MRDVTVDDMTFNVSGYLITKGPNSGDLMLGGGTGAHVITTIGNATIEAPLAHRALPRPAGRRLGSVPPHTRSPARSTLMPVRSSLAMAWTTTPCS